MAMGFRHIALKCKDIDKITINVAFVKGPDGEQLECFREV